MSERGPTLLHALRETFATFQRGRGVLLHKYSLTMPHPLVPAGGADMEVGFAPV